VVPDAPDQPAVDAILVAVEADGVTRAGDDAFHELVSGGEVVARGDERARG
jgi:hypothetical protein